MMTINDLYFKQNGFVTLWDVPYKGKTSENTEGNGKRDLAVVKQTNFHCVSALWNCWYQL